MGVGLFEAILYVWIAAFAYDEMSGAVDAGVLFYQMDFWSLWNLGIIGVGFAFIITREASILLESALQDFRCCGDLPRLVGLMVMPQESSG